MEEKLCNVCNTRPAMKDDLLCKECFDRYSHILRSATQRTRNAISSSQQEYQLAQLELPETRSAEHGSEVRDELHNRKLTRIGYFMLVIGFAALVSSVALTSTVLAFIGLGLVFWGVLVFLIRPQKYVRTDLMNATTLSSLKTIDKMVLDLGYHEKGVYIPVTGSDKAIVFIPSEPFSRIPQSTVAHGKIFVDDPKGMLIGPPGLALSSLIEKKLRFKLKNCGVEKLVQALPKVLVEDLEIVRDVEIEVKEDYVNFKLVDSIYADSCREVRETSRRCGLGCPMCSALACVLATASGKPVLFEEDKPTADKRTTITSYQLLNESRL